MKKILLLAYFLLVCLCLTAQNIGIGNSSPHASAQLDITANGKGILIPRITTSQLAGFASPAKGLMVYDTTANQLLINMGNETSPSWQTVVAKSGWGLKG